MSYRLTSVLMAGMMVVGCTDSGDDRSDAAVSDATVEASRPGDAGDSCVSDCAEKVCETENPVAPNPPCEKGWYLYEDFACAPPPEDAGYDDAAVLDTDEWCDEYGDNRCHQFCMDDGDCTDPCLPKCCNTALYDYMDYSDFSINICRVADVDDVDPDSCYAVNIIAESTKKKCLECWKECLNESHSQGPASCFSWCYYDACEKLGDDRGVP